MLYGIILILKQSGAVDVHEITISQKILALAY